MRSAIGIIAIVMSVPLSAQWLNYPTPGVPRLADGKPNLSAPAPKTADGKPDLSGVWMTKGGYTGNIAKDLKPGEVSFQPWAETLLQASGGDERQRRSPGPLRSLGRASGKRSALSFQDPEHQRVDCNSL